MVNVAVLEYSADANSGMRQVKCFFPALSTPSEDNKKGCSFDQPPRAPRGFPKYPRGLTRKKILFLKGGSKQLRML